jgi:gamma-D-glutamyl-L-lysine dipeptidyl-peptidase
MEVDGKNDAREKFKFRYVVRSVVICALLTGSLAGAQQSLPNADLVVSRPVANMYKSATADSEVTSQVLYGTGVRSLEKQGDWINIRTADDYSGWIASADVNATNGASRASGGKLVRVTALSANVYREPDVTEHAAVLRLPWESILEVAADSPKDDARWLKVRLVDGQTAWVQHGDVEEKGAPLSIEEMLRLARRFLGTTYTWGGTSSFGFDCSGFTQMLVRQRGIEMPRDADLQAGWSGVMSVDRKNLQPGDLLFFGSNASRITHTGMYLGHGEFIHDTTHDHPGVQISRIDDLPWTKLLVATRRVKQ